MATRRTRGARWLSGFGGLVLLVWACQQRPPNNALPPSASASSSATTPRQLPPAPIVAQPADAGVLGWEDAEALTPPPRVEDAAALPAIVPPLQGIQETCELAMGRPVFFTQTSSPGGDFQGGDGYRVYEDAAAFRTLVTLGQLGTVDPQRQRLVRIKVMDRPSAHVTAVVDRGDAVVISVDAPAYCGGARPFSPVIDVVLPRSSKPVVVQSCSHGRCVGMPLP